MVFQPEYPSRVDWAGNSSIPSRATRRNANFALRYGPAYQIGGPKAFCRAQSALRFHGLSCAISPARLSVSRRFYGIRERREEGGQQLFVLPHLIVRPCAIRTLSSCGILSNAILPSVLRYLAACQILTSSARNSCSGHATNGVPAAGHRARLLAYP